MIANLWHQLSASIGTRPPARPSDPTGSRAEAATTNAKAAGPLARERDALVAETRAWGYFDGSYRDLRPSMEGRRLLDIGMGGGPFSVAAIEVAGCASYVGVDPLVGTESVRDVRSDRDPKFPQYHAFPYSPADIMRLYPNVRLYADVLENVKAQVRAHKVDMAYMSSVTEHLQHLPEVFETIWETLEPGSRFWFSHHGYHSWTGHHEPPREIADLDPADPKHLAVIDWKHLETNHPRYSDVNLNRVRLADFRVLVEKYFDIHEWRLNLDAAGRLTPELRDRHRKYTLRELLGRSVTCLAIRRDRPLSTDVSAIPFHHPPESYLADADHRGDTIEDQSLQGLVYFASPTRLCSHSTNDFAARRVFALLSPGDRIRVRKQFIVHESDIAEFQAPRGHEPSIYLNTALPEEIFRTAAQEWTIDAIKTWRPLNA
jgi:SAM-dependent methyltransferase